MTIRDWKAGAAGQGGYAFTPPAGTKKLDAKDLATLKETADLPENYKIGAAKSEWCRKAEDRAPGRDRLRRGVGSGEPDQREQLVQPDLSSAPKRGSAAR